VEMAIDLRGVSKLYRHGQDAVGVHELSLQAGAGQVVALLGHNAAGKTTLIRGLATLLRFDAGQAWVAGWDVATQPQRVRERIALVGQGVAVDELLSATRNLVLLGRLRGMSREQANQRAATLISAFGLAGAEDRPVSGFSGGMRRRLDVAASMIVRPEVLFIDEPTTGLDPAARRDLWRALRVLVGGGTTVLLTTQYLEEADALADHIVLLARGRAVAEGTSDDLKGMLGHPLIRFRFETPDQATAARSGLVRLDPSVELNDAVNVGLPARERDSLANALGVLTGLGISPVEASLRRPSLDEVFLSLTADAEPSPSDAVKEGTR
jgi:ABC-type multidrug transport system ATPase subunit